MRTSKIVMTVAGAVLAVLGLVFAAAGATVVWAHTTQRDASGFYTTPVDTLATPGYAIVGQADLGSQASRRDWVPAHPAGTVRIDAQPPTGSALFVGIGPRADVESYLSGVARTRVTSVHTAFTNTETTSIGGVRTPASVPGAQEFWVASRSGVGPLSVLWPSQSGRWEAVIMNADASPGVTATVQVGVATDLLLPIGLGLGLFGLLLLAGSGVLMLLGLRSADAGIAPPAAAPTPEGSYPVRLDGHLDPATSRWLWLFKWILVVPHAVVLVVLWLAMTVMTVVAGFAILFTGRYPRSLFDFNVGVMRWTWRVGFYTFDAFGTDRYPPFSLRSDPGYPADLNVEYPQRLSRGLVLVKWWLLAIPHYLIVGVFAGGWGLGWFGNWRAASGGGLIALLAFIAAVIMAVTGRYPQGLFDFIMGMNRWCYRVVAYAALMRDEYPPFRLDTGGADPASFSLPPQGQPDRGGALVTPRA